MQSASRLRKGIVWTALCLTPFVFAGPASAQLDKQEQKCANSINKGAAKVAKAQAGDNAACIKNGSKGKLTTSIEACLTGDVKGKVAKAISKIKTADCSGGSAPSFLPGLETSSAAIGDIMKAKDLNLIHDIFGTDLDVFVSKDKAAGGCQAAIAKALGKCQDAKLSSFNACKKDKLKAGDTDIESCLGTGTGSIPDGKGKIQKKCGGDFGIAKKCGGQNLDALLPGCGGGAGAACIDQKIECRVCLALNALDGLNRSCDLFDDGVANGSCGVSVCGNGVIEVGEDCDPPGSTCSGGENCLNCICVPEGLLGEHVSELDPDAVCEGGDRNGQVCTSALPPFPPIPGLLLCPGGTCVPLASHLTIENRGGINIPALTDSTNIITCGNINPVNGTAECTTETLGIAGQDISVIGFLCFRPRPDLNCAPGLIDCDGGTPMDQRVEQHHNVAEFANAQDPVTYPVPFCGLIDSDCLAGGPDCNANDECSDMCDLWCASRGPNFVQEESGCEGFCQVESGPKDTAICITHADCCLNVNCTIDDVSCAGGSVNAAHVNSCQCECLAQGIGAPSRPGGLRVEVGLQAWIELEGPCDQLDVDIVLEPDCVSFTTESSSAFVNNDNNDEANDYEAVPLMGDPGEGCTALITSVATGSKLVAHSGNFDSTIGDLITRSQNVSK